MSEPLSNNGNAEASPVLPAFTESGIQVPKFGAIIIGDEIISGKRQDRHFSQVISALKTRGLALAWCEYLGDDRARISASLRRSMQTSDVVFSFGGIGATPDDYTRQAAAAACDAALVRHPQAVAEIEARFGEAAYPKRVLMAEFPAGATIIPNPVNRIAGFSVRDHHFLPGFPEMAWPMMDWVLDTYYPALFHRQPQIEASILVMDAGESQLLDLMNAIVAAYPAVKLFCLPKLEKRRTLELGVKGDPILVLQAIADMKAGVSATGFEWHVITDETP